MILLSPDIIVSRLEIFGCAAHPIVVRDTGRNCQIRDCLLHDNGDSLLSENGCGGGNVFGPGNQVYQNGNINIELFEPGDQVIDNIIRDS